MLVNISRRWPLADRKSGPVLAGPGSNRKRRAVHAGAAERPLGIDVRPARITDMREVEPLITRFANDNVMLPKSFDQLARSFREFVVATDEGGRVLGCGALRVYNEELAEVCSLAVAEEFQGMGIGGLIVERLIENARELGLDEVFALTLRPDFFARLGFAVTPKENSPLKVWADCRSCPKLHACDEIAVGRKV
jgi:N-acetylglutamate synthase-like GNAT family acetyltransferase